MKDLSWFRDVGYRVTRTRYDYLHVASLRGVGIIPVVQILATDDAGDVDVHGPTYKTVAEAMGVLDRVAADWTGQDPAPLRLASRETR